MLPIIKERTLENRLNELNGSQWLYWTNSIYETSFPPDSTHSLRKRHGAMKPPQLMAEIIYFFTKRNELILDPFAGVGGTLLGAELAGRRAIGIELNPLWVEIYRKIETEYRVFKGELLPLDSVEDGSNCFVSKMYNGDCLDIMRKFDSETFAAIITDPPYGCNHHSTGFKNETNFNMYSGDRRDFGNSFDYQDFLLKIEAFGKEAVRLLIPKHYLILLVGDRYHCGEYLPLGNMVADTLRKTGFKWKGTRIWWNKATQRRLKPYAINTCFIPNITHQNILIMRKE